MIRFPDARFRVLYCSLHALQPDSDAEREEVTQRIEERKGRGYTGGTNSYDRWVVLRNRYDPIVLPHLVLNTAPPNTVWDCVAYAFDYILNAQVHDSQRPVISQS